MRTSHSVLRSRAATMRVAPTTTEAILWLALKGSQFGVGFRRQFISGRYIADFCARKARLIVEVDGGYHASRVRADARRDRDLGRLGYRVLRLSAELVLKQPEQAVALIRAALASP